VPKQRGVLLCIPPKYPSNFLLNIPNPENGAEGKTIEKAKRNQSFIRNTAKKLDVSRESDIT
jgi:hypothetical protein